MEEKDLLTQLKEVVFEHCYPYEGITEDEIAAGHTLAHHIANRIEVALDDCEIDDLDAAVEKLVMVLMDDEGDINSLVLNLLSDDWRINYG